MEYQLFVLFSRLVPAGIAILIGTLYLLIKNYHNNPILFKNELKETIKEFEEYKATSEDKFEDLESKYNALNEKMLTAVFQPQLEEVKEKFEGKLDRFDDKLDKAAEENRTLFQNLTDTIINLMEKK